MTASTLRSLSLKLALVPAFVALSACSSPKLDPVKWLPTPYKVDVVQGNVVTEEQAALIKTGQSKLQVRDILGSPLLNDIFHTNRWDYVFTLRRAGDQVQKVHMSLSFDGDTLREIRREALPTEKDFVASIDTFKGVRKAPQLSLSEEEKSKLAKPISAPDTRVAPATTEPPRQYPPLER